MDPQKEIEHLREKVALLERCVECERLLREMREAAPKEPLIIPGPFDVPFRSWMPGRNTDPYLWWDNTVIC